MFPDLNFFLLDQTQSQDHSKCVFWVNRDVRAIVDVTFGLVRKRSSGTVMVVAESYVRNTCSPYPDGSMFHTSMKCFNIYIYEIIEHNENSRQVEVLSSGAGRGALQAEWRGSQLSRKPVQAVRVV